MRKGSIVNTITGVIMVAILLIIGVTVFGNFESNVDHSTITGNASQAINATATQTYSGFQLGSLIPYILFAVAIIGVLVVAFRFKA